MKMVKGALMGKQQLGIAFLSILCVSVFATTATATAYSESFPLIESASVTRLVFANEGNRLVGNFTVSNIPTWTDSNTSDSVTVQYAFKVSKIEGSEQCSTDIVLYEVAQTEHGSLTYSVNIQATTGLDSTLELEILPQESGAWRQLSSTTWLRIQPTNDQSKALYLMLN